MAREKHAQSDDLPLKLLNTLDRMEQKLDALIAEGNRRPEPHLSVREVAKIVGRSAPTICRWIRQGRLEATRVDGSGRRSNWLIHRDNLNTILARGRRTNALSETADH